MTFLEKRQFPERKNERGTIHIAILLVLLLTLLLSAIDAYFSDVKYKDGATSTSNLTISADYEFYVNGSVNQLSSITGLNPGDVIVIKAIVTNNSKSSAWIRETIELTLEEESYLSFFKVYLGNYTHQDFISSNLENNLLTTVDNISASKNKVIDGTEDALSGVDYDYIQSTTYTAYYTIYFLPTATNEMQNKSIDFKVSTQALQFKNNNTSEPSEDAWATVTVAN